MTASVEALAVHSPMPRADLRLSDHFRFANQINNFTSRSLPFLKEQREYVAAYQGDAN